MNRRNIAIDIHEEPFLHPHIALSLVRTQSQALLAKPFVNKRSYYYKWILDLIENDGMIELHKFAKLRKRLVRVQGEQAGL